MADGTIISDGQGHYKIAKGGQWVDYTGPLPGAKAAATSGRSQQQTQKFLNELSTEAANAAEVERHYQRARKAVEQLKPGPYRGRFLQAATPEEGGGILDTIGAIVIGGPARLTGAIRPKETDAYQILKGLQSEQVLGKQLLQKGPQTESDAARLQLTEISPNKSPEANMNVIQNGIAKTRRIRAKAVFYTKFAQQYGLNGTNDKGETADEIWAKKADAITKQLFNDQVSQSGGDIRVLSRRKVP